MFPNLLFLLRSTEFCSLQQVHINMSSNTKKLTYYIKICSPKTSVQNLLFYGCDVTVMPLCTRDNKRTHKLESLLINAF